MQESHSYIVLSKLIFIIVYSFYINSFAGEFYIGYASKQSKKTYHISKFDEKSNRNKNNLSLS